MKLFMCFMITLFLSGCLGLTGTHITGKIPVVAEDGSITHLEFDYSTDDSKELSGVRIQKQSDGSWAFILEKSSSIPNNVMAEAFLEMAKKIPVSKIQ